MRGVGSKAIQPTPFIYASGHAWAIEDITLTVCDELIGTLKPCTKRAGIPMDLAMITKAVA